MGVALRSLNIGGDLSDSRPNYLPLGRNLRYPLDRRLSGPQNKPGRGGKEKHHCSCPESTPGRSAPILITVLTKVSINYISVVSLKSKILFISLGYIIYDIRPIFNAVTTLIYILQR
jgi:hypothetical protein